MPSPGQGAVAASRGLRHQRPLHVRVEFHARQPRGSALGTAITNLKVDPVATAPDPAGDGGPVPPLAYGKYDFLHLSIVISQPGGSGLPAAPTPDAPPDRAHPHPGREHASDELLPVAGPGLRHAWLTRLGRPRSRSDRRPRLPATERLGPDHPQPGTEALPDLDARDRPPSGRPSGMPGARRGPHSPLQLGSGSRSGAGCPGSRDRISSPRGVEWLCFVSIGIHRGPVLEARM